jgi:hypothetical protein
MFNKIKLLRGLDKFTRENPNANGTRFTSKHKWASARTMKKCQIKRKIWKSANELEREMNGV